MNKTNSLNNLKISLTENKNTDDELIYLNKNDNSE